MIGYALSALVTLLAVSAALCASIIGTALLISAHERGLRRVRKYQRQLSASIDRHPAGKLQR